MTDLTSLHARPAVTSLADTDRLDVSPSATRREGAVTLATLWTYIASKIAGAPLRVKGYTNAALPTLAAGDAGVMVVVSDENTLAVWTGSAWQKLAKPA